MTVVYNSHVVTLHGPLYSFIHPEHGVRDACSWQVFLCLCHLHSCSKLTPPWTFLCAYSKAGSQIFCTACEHRIAHRKWKETKQQPGTAGPGNMLGWCLLSLHFLCYILCSHSVPYMVEWEWSLCYLIKCTESCKKSPACLNFPSTELPRGETCRQSDISPKIGGNYRNLAGICLHNSVLIWFCTCTIFHNFSYLLCVNGRVTQLEHMPSGSLVLR